MAGTEHDGKGRATLSIKVDADKHLKRRVRNYVDRNSLALSVWIALLLVALCFSSGYKAVVIVLAWIGLSMMLTIFQRLQNRYSFTLEDQGLSVMQNNDKGEKSAVILLWGQIAAVEKVDDSAGNLISLRLKIEKGVLSRAQRAVLSPIVSGSSKQPCLEIFVEDLGSRAAGQDLLRFMKEYLSTKPWSTTVVRAERLKVRTRLTQTNALTSQTKLPPTAQLSEKAYPILRYDPHRLARERTLAFLKRSETLLRSGFGLVLVLLSFSFGLSAGFAVLGLALLLLLLSVAGSANRPEAIGFDKSGLSFKWSGSGRTTIAWKNIERVYSKQINGQDWIYFVLASGLFGTWRRKALSIIMSDYFEFGQEASFKLNVDGLHSPDARFDILFALRENLDSSQLDPLVLDLLNPITLSGYTTLWFDSLRFATRRDLSAELSPGQERANGRYIVEGPIGAGGQATIYLARATEKAGLNCSQVVLKEFVLPSHAGKEISMRSLEHVRKEYDFLKALQAPQIVACHDLFVEDHRAYLVLDYVEGLSLRQLVERDGPLSEERVLELLSQMLDILLLLHGLNPPVIHRDFSPENIMLRSDGRLILIDFNVAQHLEENVTRTIVGKHRYMAPEQFRGMASIQSDIYSLGATLYFLSTAKDPEPITRSSILAAGIRVSPEFDGIVVKATELDQAKRFSSVAEIQAAQRY